MIKDHLAIMYDLKKYTSPKSRLTRLLKAGTLIQLRRGLFVDANMSTSPSFAPVIYGPSYLSFQYAMSVHGLIPERVTSFISASYNKNKDKVFHTPLGDYYYLPKMVYPYGVLLKEEAGYTYLLATPEKALCDSLCKVSGIANYDDLVRLLLEDWRMNKETLLSLDSDFIAFIAPMYRRRSLLLFAEFFKK